MMISVEKTLLGRLIELAHVGLEKTACAQDADEIKGKLADLRKKLGAEKEKGNRQAFSENGLLQVFSEAGLTPSEKAPSCYEMQRGAFKVTLRMISGETMEKVTIKDCLVLRYFNTGDNGASGAIIEEAYGCWEDGIWFKVHLFSIGAWAAKRRGDLVADLMKREFHRFPALESNLVALMEQFGFVNDLSYHNDACPSFGHIDGFWTIWIDHPDKSQREFEEVDRFVLTQTDLEGTPAANPYATVESVEDLALVLEKWQASRAI